MTEYNIYCDESCHLEHREYTADNRYMVIGGVSVPKNTKREVFNRLKEIKKKHQMSRFAEMKWTKLSQSKTGCYKEFIDYFFDKDILRFRCVVIDKQQLNREKHISNHNDFYYKMYFQMLSHILDNDNNYNIYLDIKDTLGRKKTEKLLEILRNNNYDFDGKNVKKCQQIQSSEAILIELVDILIGVISYANRNPSGGKSVAKNELVAYFKKRSKLSLVSSTILGAPKCNIFCWRG